MDNDIMEIFFAGMMVGLIFSNLVWWFVLKYDKYEWYKNGK